MASPLGYYPLPQEHQWYDQGNLEHMKYGYMAPCVMVEGVGPRWFSPWGGGLEQEWRDPVGQWLLAQMVSTTRIWLLWLWDLLWGSKMAKKRQDPPDQVGQKHYRNDRGGQWWPTVGFAVYVGVQGECMELCFETNDEPAGSWWVILRGQTSMGDAVVGFCYRLPDQEEND